MLVSSLNSLIEIYANSPVSAQFSRLFHSFSMIVCAQKLRYDNWEIKKYLRMEQKKFIISIKQLNN